MLITTKNETKNDTVLSGMQSRISMIYQNLTEWNFSWVQYPIQNLGN